MKKSVSLFILLMSLSINSFGQDALIYTSVVQVDSISKNELYNRAKIWLVETYNNAEEVIQIDNKEQGIIVGKATMQYNPSYNTGSAQTEGSIKYTIKILFKNGRYKYVLTDFIHDPFGNQYGEYNVGLITTQKEAPDPKFMAKKWSNKVWNDIKDQIEIYSTSLTSNLKKKMTKETDLVSDDW